MKRISLLLFFVTSLFLFVQVLYAVESVEDVTYIDPDIPDSWYKAPKTASEVGIQEFNQSPMLDKRVAEGKLPPVEERLPDDPPVIEPYSKVGKYGGTANMWGTGLPGGNARFWNQISAAKSTADGQQVPFYIRGWEYTDDYKKLTIHLRKGIQWSDGEPLTADEYQYLWKYVLNNKKLYPVPPEEQSPPLADITVKDKWTVTFHFAEPTPWADYYLIFNMTPLTEGKQLFPAHFMKQFHPEIADREKVEQRAEEQGVEWQEEYTRMQRSDMHPEYSKMRPSLKQYIAVKRTVSSLILERNPYYPFVDTEGNQLPYIDRIRVDLANNGKMAASKAATGEATFATRNLNTSAIPLYKKYGPRSNYKTLIYRRAVSSEVAIVFNITHEEPALRRIFSDFSFRKAMSFAIDRKDINRKLYFNTAVPMQATAAPPDPLHNARLAQKYTDFKPEKARNLLDEMGLKDVNGDGFREKPDGSKFNPQFMYCKMGPVNPTSLLEMVISDWRDVGVQVDLKMLNRGLWNMRCKANKMDATGWIFDIGGPRAETPHGLQSIAPVSISSSSPWTQWALWYESNGEEGMEPPPIGKKLIDKAEIILKGTDMKKRHEAKKFLVESLTDNLWRIGTVGLPPQPLIISEDIRNFPKTGLWGWQFGAYLGPYHTEQVYLE